jgi:hypothetical protein
MMRVEYRIETFLHPHGAHNVTPSVTEYLARVNALGAEGWVIIPAAGLPSGGVLLARESYGRPPDNDNGDGADKPKLSAPGDA